jgi:hypothetical protein
MGWGFQGWNKKFRKLLQQKTATGGFFLLSTSPTHGDEITIAIHRHG